MICPRCNNYSFRIMRKTSDRIIDVATLGLLSVKRFKCFYCYWEGRVVKNSFEIKLFKADYKH